MKARIVFAEPSQAVSSGHLRYPLADIAALVVVRSRADLERLLVLIQDHLNDTSTHLTENPDG